MNRLNFYTYNFFYKNRNQNLLILGTKKYILGGCH